MPCILEGVPTSAHPLFGDAPPKSHSVSVQEIMSRVERGQQIYPQGKALSRYVILSSESRLSQLPSPSSSLKVLYIFPEDSKLQLIAWSSREISVGCTKVQTWGRHVGCTPATCELYHQLLAPKYGGQDAYDYLCIDVCICRQDHKAM